MRAGFLEEVDGYRVLHIKGTPTRWATSTGPCSRDDIREQVRYLFDVKAKEMTVELGGVKLLDPKRVIPGSRRPQRKYVPERFFEEMRGIADGAGMDVQDIIAANFIPELFHCSGFALSGSATKDGTLYHGRILDYGCDWKLQEHAVLTVAEPEGKIPFVNVTYAGFVGSVTGMNARAGLDRRDGGPGHGPLGRHANGPARPHGARGSGQPRRGHRDLSRSSPDLRVLLRARRRQDGQGGGHGGSWDVFGMIAMGEAIPGCPSDPGRGRALGRRPLQGAGPPGQGRLRDVRRRVAPGT